MGLDIRGPLCTRENRSNFEVQATRSSFITRQDARNIVRRFENAIKHRHQNDAVSVDRLVSELQKAEDNPVIAYKSQVHINNIIRKLSHLKITQTGDT